jgi:hypothetical protein
MNALTSITFAGDASATTDTTDYSGVTNNDFLIGIFGAELTVERPVTCFVPGNPHTAAKKHWIGKPWFPAISSGDIGANAYFSMSTYLANNQGETRRTQAGFFALHAIMFDDVGTKAAGFERLVGLEPSWIIETSPGNFQVGYIFAVPITDVAIAQALYKSVIEAGLCDPGAGGPQTRLGRLPNGINGKYDEPFECRLHLFKPENRYTPEQIVSGLGLALDLKAAAASGSTRQRGHADLHHDAVYTPRASENAVVTALKAAKLYKQPLGEGKHDITCPWVNEHTEAIDQGTAYFEPNVAFPVGGFSCLHGHCEHRTVSDLQKLLNGEVL